MDLIAQIEAEQVAALGHELPDFKAGDTVRVGFKVTEGTRTRVQNYEGVCISRKNGKGIAGSFTVRKISFGEGVERVFPLHSTNIDSITAVVIGGISLFGGRGSIMGMLFGAVIVGVFSLGLRLMGADAQWTYLLIGVLIIFAVAIDQWIRKVSA